MRSPRHNKKPDHISSESDYLSDGDFARLRSLLANDGLESSIEAGLAGGAASTDIFHRPEPHAVRKKEGWAALEMVIRSSSEPHGSGLRRFARNSQGRFIAFACGAVALILTVIGVHTYWQSDALYAALMGSPTVYSTPPGSRATVQLRDGTQVLLNVDSRLEVSNSFGSTSRTVTLVGEAFFNVTHSVGIPFIVSTFGSETRVLGTEFAVKAYSKENLSVAVKSGRVAVDQSPVSANEIYTHNQSGTQTLVVGSVDDAIGFTTGKLILSNVRLIDAIPELNRWYNVNIELAELDLGKLIIDAVLFDGSIGDLTEVLERIFQVNVVRRGRDITLSP